MMDTPRHSDRDHGDLSENRRIGGPGALRGTTELPLPPCLTAMADRRAYGDFGVSFYWALVNSHHTKAPIPIQINHPQNPMRLLHCCET
jgi:hypothetical protein